MTFVSSDASIFSKEDEAIFMDGLYLTADGEYEGAPVFLSEHQSHEWYMYHIGGGQTPDIDETKWVIRFGGFSSSDAPHRKLRLCLNFNASSSLLSLQQCGSYGGVSRDPQLFTLVDWDTFYAENDRSTTPYLGRIQSCSGECLEASTATGNATARTCDGSDHQIWGQCKTSFSSHPNWDHANIFDNCPVEPTAEPVEPTAAPTAGTMISHSVTGLCMDLPGGDTTNGALLWMWDCYGGESQQWSFLPTPQGYKLVYEVDTTKCVDLLGDWTNGNQLGLWDCLDGQESQQWGFDQDAGTIYLASSEHDASKCIRIAGENQGDAIEIWDCNGEDEQLWKTLGPELHLSPVVV